jgi:hypothetical protein
MKDTGYVLDIYYQENAGKPHVKIDSHKLCEYVGWELKERIIQKVTNRMMFKTIPEIESFFKYGGRQVVATELTSRGNVYIEAVEVEHGEHGEQ